jgi:DNA processing protein
MGERGLLDLMIARLPELSIREKILLCELLESEQDLIEKSRNDIETIINRRLANWWDNDDIRLLAERDVEKARLRGIKWLSWQNVEYPPLLREIYDPPVLLFYLGSLPNPELPLVAVVGTRKPSIKAAAQAFNVARDLGSCGISVISGLALGIDAMAHRGNVEGGARSVAVLGSGLDRIYPSSNRGLARKILETGGALLSEYPPGTGPFKWNFPARNRIISGLSRGVVIVEAPQKSGALITARFALDHNRDLWVASAGASADEQRAFDRTGTIKLVDEGAGIVHCAQDILQAWNIQEIVLDQEQTMGDCALASSLAHSLGITLQED